VRPKIQPPEDPAFRKNVEKDRLFSFAAESFTSRRRFKMEAKISLGDGDRNNKRMNESERSQQQKKSKAQ